MKKSLLLSMMCMAATELFAADLTVTSPSGDSNVAGSFPNVVTNAASGDVINFDLDAEALETFDALKIESKSLTINGLNKKNDKKIKFEGTKKVLDINGGVISFNNCIFTGKTEQSLFIQNSGVLNVDKCEFINNVTTATGGCIGISTLCTANITNSLFKGNKGSNGGCFRVYNKATLNVTACTFMDNKATQHGGCIYVYTTANTDAVSTVNLSNSTFVRNQAGDRGGVLYAYSRYVDNTQPLVSKIVNCTFTGNYSQKNIGGALCVFSNSNCASKLVLVNSIVVGNVGGLVDGAYFVPQDICIYDGNADANGNVYPRSYAWDLKNNLIGVIEKTADDKQINNIKLDVADNSNIFITDFAKANIYSGIYRLDNSFNEDMEAEDVVYCPTISEEGGMPVAMISSNSIAKGAGIATYANVTVPTIDQLGKTRPASPAIGAVEFATLTGMAAVIADETSSVWYANDRLYTNVPDGEVTLYTVNGQLVKSIAASELPSVSLKAYQGTVLIAKVKSASTTKVNRVIVK